MPFRFLLFILWISKSVGYYFQQHDSTVPVHVDTSFEHLSRDSISTNSILLVPHHTIQLKVFSSPILFFSNDTIHQYNQSFLRIKKENLTLFSLTIDQTRVPLLTGALINCSFHHRLRAKRNHKLTIQTTIEDYQAIVLLFLDGILTNKCIENVNSTMVSVFDGIGEITFLPANVNHHFNVNNITYYPYHLRFGEILANSLPLSTSTQPIETTIEGESPSPQLRNDNFQKTLILLWPSYYSIPQSYRSIEWQIQHINESLTMLIQDLLLHSSDSSLFHLILPLTPLLSQDIFNHLSQYEFITITILETSLFSDNSASPSYPQFFNFIFQQLSSKQFYSNIFNLKTGFYSSFGLKFTQSILNTPPENVILISTHIQSRHKMITGLIAEINSVENALIGGTIINLRNEIESYGFEFYELPYVGGLEKYLIPHARYRGYQITDPRVKVSQSSEGLSRHLMGFSMKTWNQLVKKYFLEEMSPGFEDYDFCFSASKEGVNLLVTNRSQGVSLEESFNPMYLSNSLSSERYDPINLSRQTQLAMNQFSLQWRETIMKTIHSNYLTTTRVTWVIHCGGSQGLEAATILQSLHKLLNIRTLIRNYKYCEHADTISGMPAYFRDILEMTALKSFTPIYQENRSTSNELEDGSVVIYARDYREMGRWFPQDTSYIIGRYMYETDSLPMAWTRHCNNLNEIWVPSQWQRNTFTLAGVKHEKIQVLPETIDSNFFNLNGFPDLPLPGTVLDQYDREDITRPYTFCSVFKMEDRKGYQELVESFMKEFQFDVNVVLLLRTYLHTGVGIHEENFDMWEIRKIIDNHLQSCNLPLSDHFDGIHGPRIEIVNTHLSSEEMVMFYQSCDAFVLPSHAEGWGLPTHEAMVMGLPVITTNWGGSTEFVSSSNSLLLNVTDLIPTSGDDWLDGHKWAKIEVNQLQQLLRELYNDKEFGRSLGKKGMQDIKRFSMDKVAALYANRILAISQKTLKSSSTPKLRATQSNQKIRQRYSDEGALIASNLDSKWPLSARFKACSLRTYREINRALLIPPHSNYHIRCNIGMITTWPPRRCGIATFSSQLRDSLLSSSQCPLNQSRVDIIAVLTSNDSSQHYNSSIVQHTFFEHESSQYLQTAKFINSQRYHTIFLQLEFGIYDMDNLLCMLREIKSHALYTIVHTVHVNLFETQHSWLQQIAFLSTKLIVLSHTMRYILNVFHGIPTRDILVITHGGPNLPFMRYDLNYLTRSSLTFSPTSLSSLSSSSSSSSPSSSSSTPEISSISFPFPILGKKIIFSNGLIHPFKGFEYMIRALPQVVAAIPDVVYVISGIPHPTGDGCEQYYNSLILEANLSTVSSHIYFDNTYRSNEDLYTLLRHSHVYVNPYTNTGQSVSGTLTMALSVGTISISTPYPYARELLRPQNGIGKLVPFHSVNSLATAVIEILKQNNSWHESKTREVYQSSQQYTWSEIAKQYLNL